MLLTDPGHLARKFLGVGLLSLVFSAASVTPSIAAEIDYMSAGGQADLCAQDDRTGLALCYQFLRGAVQGLEMVGMATGRPLPYCDAAKKLTTEQVRADFVAFVAQNPGHKKYAAASVVFAALSKYHPCPKSGR